MPHRILSVLLLTGVALLGAVPAQAATVKADSTIRLATISSKGTPPAAGSSSISAGRITGSSFGAGAIIAKVTYGENLSFTTKARSYGKRGTVTSTLKGTAKVNPDGSVSLRGTGTFTGGTARYKGAKGKLTFTGRVPKDSQVAIFKIKGSFSYSKRRP